MHLLSRHLVQDHSKSVILLVLGFKLSSIFIFIFVDREIPLDINVRGRTDGRTDVVVQGLRMGENWG